MTWVTPYAGLLLGAIVIPLLLLLYFLRLRRQPLRISSTMLWERAVEDLHANTPFQRLRPSALLILQLLALILVILAIMQPQLEGGSSTKGTHVLLIDRSGSMEAKYEDGRTRLDIAKEKASEVVDQIYGGGLFSSSGGKTMVISFADHAEVISPFTDSKQQLINAIHSIQPSHGQSMVGESLQLARAYTTTVDPEKDGLAASESAQLELFSDGRIEDIQEQTLQRGETMQYHMVGLVDDSNVGISTIDAKRPTQSSDEVQVFLSLLNSDDEQKVIDVELRIDGTPVGVQQVLIPKMQNGVLGTASLVFVPFKMPQSGVIQARLLHQDSLEIDNQASLFVPPAKELSVLLAEEDPPIIRTVLEGIPLKKLQVVNASEIHDMIGSGESSEFDVIVTRGVQLDSITRGNYLIFGEPPPIPSFETHVDGESQVMLVANESHPVMRFVRYEDIVVMEGFDVVLDQSTEVLLEGSHWPAVTSSRGSGIQLIYVSFDPVNSNWPYLRSFPFFVFNSVQFLGHQGELLTASTKQVGQAIQESVLVGGSVTIAEPDGSTHTIIIDGNGNASWGPIRISGVHTMSTEKDVLKIAINSPTAESDIASVEEISLGATDVKTTGTSGSSFIQLWPWALGAVLIVLLAEWWVYQKKVSTPFVRSWTKISTQGKGNG
jgi:hypothetical protein